MFKFTKDPQYQCIDEERGITVSGTPFPPPTEFVFTYRDPILEFHFVINDPPSPNRSEEWKIHNSMFDYQLANCVRRKGARRPLTPEDVARIKRDVSDALAVWGSPPGSERPLRTIIFVDT